MPTLRDTLIQAGLIKPRDESVKVVLARIRKHADAYIADTDRLIERVMRRERFAQGVRQDERASRRNPRQGASVQGSARLMEAAGSDSHGKGRMSGPGTPFGMDWVKTRNEPKDRTPCRCDEHKKDASKMRHRTDPSNA